MPTVAFGLMVHIPNYASHARTSPNRGFYTMRARAAFFVVGSLAMIDGLATRLQLITGSIMHLFKRDFAPPTDHNARN